MSATAMQGLACHTMAADDGEQGNAMSQGECQMHGGLTSPTGAGLPLLAARNTDRRPWMGLAIVMQLAGFGGLWLAPQAAPILWCMLCGAGLGGSFSLIMVIALDHLPDPRRAGTLSALALTAVLPGLRRVRH